MPRQCQFPVEFSDNRRCYRSDASPSFICIVVLVALLSGYACLCKAGSVAELRQAPESDALSERYPTAAFDDARRASDEELDRMRGGFIISWNGSEFMVPFSIDGIEHLTQINGQTFVNGEPVSPKLNFLALTPLSIQTAPDGAAVTVAPAPTAVAAGSGSSGTGTTAAANIPNVQVSTQGSTYLVQVGSGNTLASPTNNPAEAMALFIQNTVNDQVIRNITTLNITIEASKLALQAQLNAMQNQLNALR